VQPIEPDVIAEREGAVRVTRIREAGLDQLVRLRNREPDTGAFAREVLARAVGSSPVLHDPGHGLGGGVEGAGARDVVRSPITGGDGNVELLLWAVAGAPPAADRVEAGLVDALEGVMAD